MLQPLKPPALHAGNSVRVVSLSSPVESARVTSGCDELRRLGYVPKLDERSVLVADGYFAGTATERLSAFRVSLAEPDTRAIFCARGGYGSNYLLDELGQAPQAAKIFVGFSDVTSLQIFMWQKYRAITFYGPMVAAALNCGAGAPNGYDRESLIRALTETEKGWPLDLRGESLIGGEASGIVLGGCLTLVEATVGTPWELETKGAILLLEDRGMKPYQVDRSLMHLKQAGKFRGVAGIVLGDFPDSDSGSGAESVKDVARRILGPLGVPVVWGAPVGHTARPMLTVPLGVRARLSANGPGRLELLEPAVVA